MMMAQMGRVEGRGPGLQGQAEPNHLLPTSFLLPIPLKVSSNCWMKLLSQIQVGGSCALTVLDRCLPFPKI